MAWAARVACGLDSLVDRFDLTGLAYYYRGLNGNANERLAASLIVGSSILTGQGVPIAGELDIKNCLAMLIMDRLEAGGSFAEIHPCDFENDIVLVGHDGPHHIGVAEGRPVLRGLDVYHGKRGAGVGVEFQLRTGPVTILSVTQTYGGKFRFVVAEGESLAGPIPPDRQHQHPLPLPARPAQLHRKLEPGRTDPPLRPGRRPRRASDRVAGPLLGHRGCQRDRAGLSTAAVYSIEIVDRYTRHHAKL